MIFIDKKRTVAAFITFFFLLTTGYFYTKNAFSFHFVDEEYNFAIGKYLLSHEVLYRDIITNHQPITHIASSFVQNYSKPNSIFLLVSRHRTAIAVWSLLWSIFFVLFFGVSALLFVFCYELTKSYLFGNLFLAETIVVYPLLFLMGLIIYDKHLSNPLELLFSGICISLCLFLLGPIWPVVTFLVLLLLYRQKNHLIKTLTFVFLGLLIIIIALWKYVSFPGYLYWYLYTNLIYTIPSYHGNETWVFTILKSFVSPVIPFITFDDTPMLWLIRIFSLLLILNLVMLRKFRFVLIIITLLGLSNIRFVLPGSGHYNGFHMLPWFGALVFIASTLSLQQFKQNIPAMFKITNIVLIISAIVFSLSYAAPVLLEKKDTQKDYLINYSTYTDRGEIIRIMKDPADTLFVSRDSWLVYWQSDTNHLPKLFGYYSWMSGIPKLHNAVLAEFTKKPPTYFYCDNCKGSDLEQFLGQYTNIKKNNNPTDLYVTLDKIKKLSESQKEQLKFYDVTFE